jgi:cytochrome c5
VRRTTLSLATLFALTIAAVAAFRGNPLKAQLAPSPDDVVAVNRGASQTTGFDRAITSNNEQLISQGRQIFRYDTFGDEAFWGDTIKLHQAIAGSANGGVGPGVSPKTALSVGLKVDMDALPASVVNAVKAGQVNLDDPKTTLTLLQLNAVVGVTGHFNSSGQMTSIGIQCALCHSTVDDAFAPGIGHRLDGWPNRDLNVGAIVALSPDLSAVDTLLGVPDATTRQVLASWGPGKFDAELFLDGKAFQPDGRSAATLIPPAFGLAGVNLHTWTGWGSVTYWNAFVANLEMHGQGNFTDSRLNDPVQFPVAARAGFGKVRHDPDLITPKLAALHAYQLSIPAPTPPASSFNAAAAQRGDDLFSGKASCSNCHMEPLMTEPGWNMHAGADIGIDEFQAQRAPDKKYRTSPLHGLFAHSKGGFFHDGRFATLLDVVNHYDTFFKLGLTDQEKSDLVEYLKSL